MDSHNDAERKKGFRPGKIFEHLGNLEEWMGPQRFVRGVVGLLKHVDQATLEKLHDRVEGFIESRFANLSDENQRRAEALRMAESRNTPVSEQIKMIEDGQNSTLVLFSAANQLHVPVEVQNRLVDLALDNEEVMSLLANNARTDLTVLARMAEAPSLKVRQQTARMLAAHMPIIEADPNRQYLKDASVVAMLMRYHPSFGRFVIPYCDDAATIERLYFEHVDDYANLQENVDAFVHNPLTPNSVLLSIATQEDLRKSPFKEVRQSMRDAAQILSKRVDEHRPNVDDAPGYEP